MTPESRESLESPHMVVAISRIRVTSGNAALVADRYRNRSRRVESAPGFLGLEVLQPQGEPDEFWIYTRWENTESYEAYRRSPAFREAHAAIAAIPGVVKIDKESHFAETFDVLAR